MTFCSCWRWLILFKMISCYFVQDLLYVSLPICCSSQLRALLGKCISKYQVLKKDDPRLQNAPTVDKCLIILRFLRLITQVILPKESLCWLVYNGRYRLKAVLLWFVVNYGEILSKAPHINTYSLALWYYDQLIASAY